MARVPPLPTPIGSRSDAARVLSRSPRGGTTMTAATLRNGPRTTDFELAATLSPSLATTMRPPSTSLGGRFRLGPPIGRGAMGVVHAAIDATDGSEIAVKLVPCPSAQSYARFAREQGVLARLPKHPALIEYIAHGQALDGRLWLAMRRLHGEPLETRLARGPLGTDDTLGWRSASSRCSPTPTSAASCTVT